MKAGNIPYSDASQISDVIPIFPLTGALLLPGGQIPLNIFEPRYLKMIEDAMSGDKLIGMIQPDLKGEMDNENKPKLSNIGCIGRLTTFQETGDGRYLVSLSGICRFKVVEELNVNTEYRQCKIEAFEEDLKDHTNGSDVNRDALLAAFKKYLNANEIEADWDVIEETDNATLVNGLSMMSPYEPAEKQALLEAKDLNKRAETLIAISEFYLAAGHDDNPSKLN